MTDQISKSKCNYCETRFKELVRRVLRIVEFENDPKLSKFKKIVISNKG